jgi:hypothetical protein
LEILTLLFSFRVGKIHFQGKLFWGLFCLLVQVMKFFSVLVTHNTQEKKGFFYKASQNEYIGTRYPESGTLGQIPVRSGRSGPDLREIDWLSVQGSQFGGSKSGGSAIAGSV